MRDLNKYIASGIIEQFVLGLTDVHETAELELLYNENQEIRDAVEQFSKSIEAKAFAEAVTPPVTIKPLLMGTFDYMNRLSSGETVTFPPILNENSTLQDYEPWLNRADAVAGKDFSDFKVFLIGYTPTCTTGIVWINEMAPEEVHEDEHERFLIAEGSCLITVGDQQYHLTVGDYLAIPLFEKHHVRVTSSEPCKVILQRIAA